MKTGLKNKIVSLITTTACIFTFASGTLPFTASAGGSGWTAHGSNAATVSITENGSVADIIAGDHSTAGAQLTNKFTPIKTGKWAFTFNLKEKIEAGWGSLSFTWAAYGTTGEPNSAVLINNGIRFNFEDAATDTPKVTIANADSGFSTIGTPQIINIDTEYRVVIEAIDGTVSVYLNNVKIGDCQSSQAYYTTESAVPSLAIGGGGRMHFVINTAPTDTADTLNELLSACTTLHDNTAASDTPEVGQAPTEAKTTFKTAIDSANAKKSGSEADLIAAVSDLTSAKAAFENAIVSADIKKALKHAVAEAEALLKQLEEANADYSALNTLITEGQTVIADASAAQNDIDAKTTALTEKMAAIKATNLIFTIDNLTASEPTGLTVKTNKNVVTFSTSNQNDKLYTWGHARISAKVPATSNLVFNLKETKHVDPQWSNFFFGKTLGPNNLGAPALRITFGAGKQAYLEEFYTIDNTSPDHSKNKTLVTFSYQNNEDIQFSFEKTGEGKLLAKINGFVVFEGDSEFADVFNGTDDIYLGYANGADSNGDQETVLTFNPDEKLSVEKGVFIATGQSGNGATDKVTVKKSDKVQSIIFGEAMDFTNGIARTVVEGPKINFSFKIAAQGPNDWKTILFSNGIDIHAANTPGLAIKIGGDLSVSAAEYGQSGVGGAALWETDMSKFFTQVGLKMIIHIYEENDKIVVKVNDTILTDDQPMTDTLRALLSSKNINMTIFGASEEGSQYDISYINETDPEPFDQPKEPEEPEIEPGIISLDDSKITVNGTNISIHEDMTIEEFFGLITYDESFTLVLLDSQGNAITDTSASTSKIAAIKMMKDEKEVATFSVNGKSVNNNNNNGNQNSGNTDTGVGVCGTAIMIFFISALGIALVIKKRRIHS